MNERVARAIEAVQQRSRQGDDLRYEQSVKGQITRALYDIRHRRQRTLRTLRWLQELEGHG